MTKAAEPSNSLRKTPRQARSEATIAAIVEAAAQILERDGEEAATTARVAERAGVSIGTLYQYFADRDAVLAAVIRRDRETVSTEIARRIAEGSPKNAEALVRDIIAALVAVMRPRRRRRRLIALGAAMRMQSADDIAATIDRVGALIASVAARYPNEVARPLTPVRAYTLTRAVMGALRAALIENAKVLDDPEFEDELVRLALAYLRA
ncbi:MAG: helix-turn-helix domain-containing protein [Parvularculaceae bacterium]|nr:helix-turn-helix domain-containing protein [Parvularculaceae bacterium]